VRGLSPDDLPAPVTTLVELRDPAFIGESRAADEEIDGDEVDGRAFAAKAWHPAITPAG
jgi:hypothetical protein